MGSYAAKLTSYFEPKIILYATAAPYVEKLRPYVDRGVPYVDKLHGPTP